MISRTQGSDVHSSQLSKLSWDHALATPRLLHRASSGFGTPGSMLPQRSSPSWSVRLVSLGSLIKLSGAHIMGLITPSSSFVIFPRFWTKNLCGLEGLSTYIAISSGSNWPNVRWTDSFLRLAWSAVSNKDWESGWNILLGITGILVNSFLIVSGKDVWANQICLRAKIAEDAPISWLNCECIVSAVSTRFKASRSSELFTFSFTIEAACRGVQR